MKKKKIIIMIITVVIMLSLLGLSWEGEFDPTRFRSWKTLDIIEMRQKGCFLVLIENPDKDSFVKRINLEICNKKPVSYHYFKLGEPYVFEYDAGKDGYFKQNLGKERRRRCFGCHPEQKSKMFTKEIDI